MRRLITLLVPLGLLFAFGAGTSYAEKADRQRVR